jgi:hypothetical protein
VHELNAWAIRMGKRKKFYDKIMSGRSDGDIDFSQAVSLLQFLRFNMRVTGSHHIFRREDVTSLINIQPLQGRMKRYQVVQLRCVFERFNIEVNDNE